MKSTLQDIYDGFLVFFLLQAFLSLFLLSCVGSCSVMMAAVVARFLGLPSNDHLQRLWDGSRPLDSSEVLLSCACVMSERCVMLVVREEATVEGEKQAEVKKKRDQRL